MPIYLPQVIDLFQPLAGQSQPTTLQDRAWQSLPMDNAADDILRGREFIELCILISKTTAVMQALKQHFDAGGLWATRCGALPARVPPRL